MMLWPEFTQRCFYGDGNMQELFDLLKRRNLVLVTAESCTGGAIAKTITDMAGASSIFERGFVTYTNQSKIEMLGVPESMLQEHGAVSAQVAQSMAEGSLKNSHGDIAVSCTGIAGPDGGTNAKPVGLVYIGVAIKNAPAKSFEHHFEGDRNAVRVQTVEVALKHVIEQI